MTTQTTVRMLATLLVAAALALHTHPLRAQAKPVPDDDTTLTADLDAELTDVEAEDQLVDEATLEDQIEADLEKSTKVDYNALEAEMEQGGTTLKKLIHHAIEEAETEAAPHFAVFLQASSPKANGRSASRNFVAEVQVIHDHVKENRKFKVSALLPNADPGC